MAGGNVVTEAVMDAVASRIRGASADMKAMAAGLSGVFTGEVSKADKFLIKRDERWERQAAAMKARGVGPTDDEYKRALARYERSVAAVEGYSDSMLLLATKIAEYAIDG